MLLANPDDNHIYVAVLPRVTSAVLSELRTLDKNPSDTALTSFGKNLSSILENNLYRVAEAGYRNGCLQVKEDSKDLDLHEIRRKVHHHTAVAVDHVLATTAKVYGFRYEPLTLEAMTRKRVKSKARAEVIAKHELRKIFQYGVRMGWAKKFGAKKRWFTRTDNPCEWCSGNEDDGPISLDDAFSSGDFEPPLHPNCGCVLMLFG